ncbi:hypothetical protein KJY73_20195 [Bowmanella sp. Y26]|uniref:hypothetical protein n=1 Tax=Bowmanella yangjiangensis TaxID=2811230 RepID=UPI001BDBB9C4|nr:hypothetical protein [Bowmanella yangjiangensis]MBT1065906.1 hypothetical protein [Bowmanella yangjiangensis]
MDKYQPNHIPVAERLFNLIWGIGLLVIAYLGYAEQSFHLPGRGSSNGIIFEGTALFLFISAAVVGAINLFITIADHYDKRDNENRYKRASRVCVGVALALVLSAVAVQFVYDRKDPVIISNGS